MRLLDTLSQVTISKFCAGGTASGSAPSGEKSMNWWFGLRASSAVAKSSI